MLKYLHLLFSDVNVIINDAQPLVVFASRYLHNLSDIIPTTDARWVIGLTNNDCADGLLETRIYHILSCNVIIPGPPSESTGCGWRYGKNILVLFSVHSVYYSAQQKPGGLA